MDVIVSSSVLAIVILRGTKSLEHRNRLAETLSPTPNVIVVVGIYPFRLQSPLNPQP